MTLNLVKTTFVTVTTGAMLAISTPLPAEPACQKLAARRLLEKNIAEGRYKTITIDGGKYITSIVRLEKISNNEQQGLFFYILEPTKTGYQVAWYFKLRIPETHYLSISINDNKLSVSYGSGHRGTWVTNFKFSMNSEYNKMSVSLHNVALFSTVISPYSGHKAFGQHVFINLARFNFGMKHNIKETYLMQWNEQYNTSSSSINNHEHKSKACTNWINTVSHYTIDAIEDGQVSKSSITDSPCTPAYKKSVPTLAGIPYYDGSKHNFINLNRLEFWVDYVAGSFERNSSDAR